MPNKFLGQHFLKDASVVQKIVAAIDPQRGETIVEIGPGHGELTRSLAEVCKKSGAKILAIEKDAALAAALKMQIDVEIIEGDALEILGERLTPPFKIVGNIPYYLTGRLLRIVSELPQKPERCVFMVQKEVALRTMGEPPRMNRLAASVQFWAAPKIIVAVPKESFDPQPEVDSAVLLLEGLAGDRSAKSSEHYYSALRALFAQPRKTVQNNLAAQLGKEGATDALRRAGIDPSLRPQNLSVENIRTIGDNFVA
jgi:16S rRNA (adenine1518-N6/adenine1519-N6)-dimethyltransferase